MRRNFEEFILYLQTLDQIPEILILTEIWIEDGEVNQFNLPQYNIFAKCNNSYWGGEVAVLVSEGLLSYVSVT